VGNPDDTRNLSRRIGNFARDNVDGPSFNIHTRPSHARPRTSEQGLYPTGAWKNTMGNTPLSEPRYGSGGGWNLRWKAERIEGPSHAGCLPHDPWFVLSPPRRGGTHLSRAARCVPCLVWRQQGQRFRATRRSRQQGAEIRCNFTDQARKTTLPHEVVVGDSWQTLTNVRQ